MQLGPAAGACDSAFTSMCSNYSREDVLNAYDTYLKLTAVNPQDPNAIAYKKYISSMWLSSSSISICGMG